MASAFSNLMGSVGLPQLQRQLGAPVTHYAGGTGSGTSVTAIVDDLNDGGMEVQQTHGVDVLRQKRLQVALSVTLTPSDQWLISGERWATIAQTDGTDGLQIVTVQRIDQSRNTRARSRGA